MSEDSDILAESIVEDELSEPKMFKVMLLNDDYTTMDFVVYILETVFGKSPAESVQVMMRVHKEGRGLCGIYTKQIAITKLDAVAMKSEQEDHPLRCVIEEV